MKTQQIRVRGTPKKFTAGEREITIKPYPDGLFYDPNRDLYVRVLDYDNHIIGPNPDFEKGKEGWFALCSCGSPAVIVGYNAYKHGASRSSGEKEIADGEYLACHTHLTYGKHGDGSS